MSSRRLRLVIVGWHDITSTLSHVSEPWVGYKNHDALARCGEGGRLPCWHGTNRFSCPKLGSIWKQVWHIHEMQSTSRWPHVPRHPAVFVLAWEKITLARIAKSFVTSPSDGSDGRVHRYRDIPIHEMTHGIKSDLPATR
jgi:hypothetical protein